MNHIYENLNTARYGWTSKGRYEVTGGISECIVNQYDVSKGSTRLEVLIGLLLYGHLDPFGNGALLHQYLSFHHTSQMFHIFHDHTSFQTLPLREVGFGEMRWDDATSKGQFVFDKPHPHVKTHLRRYAEGVLR